MAKNISIPDGFLRAMIKKGAYGPFYGSRNKRKVMILIVLLDNEGLTALELFVRAGRGATYSSFRSVLAVLVRWRYVSYRMKGRDRAYSILAKGIRLIYACQQLAPEQYQEWISLIRR